MTTKGMEKVPTVRIGKAQDTKPPLSVEVAGFLDGIMGGAVENFERDGGLRPFFFELGDGKAKAHHIRDMSPEAKPAIFKAMNERAKHNTASIFISEVWMAKAMPSEGGKVLVMPSERIDRVEQVMLVLWAPPRRLSMIAEIFRKPDHLGPWEMWEDAANDALAVGCGQMVGTSIPGEDEP